MHRSLTWFVVGIAPVGWALSLSLWIWSAYASPKQDLWLSLGVCGLLVSVASVGGFLAGRKSVVAAPRERASMLIERLMLARDVGMAGFIQMSLILGWWLVAEVDVLRYANDMRLDMALLASVLMGVCGWIALVIISRRPCPACSRPIFQSGGVLSIDYIARSCVHCHSDAERTHGAPAAATGEMRAPGVSTGGESV